MTEGGSSPANEPPPSWEWARPIYRLAAAAGLDPVTVDACQPWQVAAAAGFELDEPPQTPPAPATTAGVKRDAAVYAQVAAARRGEAPMPTPAPPIIDPSLTALVGPPRTA